MSDLQDTVVATLRDMGRATAPEMAERLGWSTQYGHNKVSRACRVLLKFRIIRVADVRRTGYRETRVYELTEGEA